MSYPREIEVLRPGTSYRVPTYVITNEGIKEEFEFTINFCKGNKDDTEAFRQEGILTESLLEVVVHYLETVNTGDLRCRESSIAITKIEEALLWLRKRSQDRQRRNVQNTYQK